MNIYNGCFFLDLSVSLHRRMIPLSLLSEFT